MALVNVTTIAKRQGSGPCQVIAWLALLFLSLANAQVAVTLPQNLDAWYRAILMTETRNQPWAVLNNTLFRQQNKPSGGIFKTRAEAEKYARDHIAMGHDLDLGLYQLNWKYQKNRPGVTLDNIFDPAIQQRISKQVLMEFYNAAVRLYGAGELAERRAVSAYNNGNIRADNVKYLKKIYKEMGRPSDHLIDTDGVRGGATIADQLSPSQSTGAAGRVGPNSAAPATQQVGTPGVNVSRELDRSSRDRSMAPALQQANQEVETARAQAQAGQGEGSGQGSSAWGWLAILAGIVAAILAMKFLVLTLGKALIKAMVKKAAVDAGVRASKEMDSAVQRPAGT